MQPRIIKFDTFNLFYFVILYEPDEVIFEFYYIVSEETHFVSFWVVYKNYGIILLSKKFCPH